MFWKKKSDKAAEASAWITVLAPFSGEVVALDEVEDPVFKQRLVGDGVAIRPSSDVLTAPVDGTLTHLFPTGHAAGLTTKEGIELLIHIGMDTVELKGEGFEKLATQGDKVKAGAKLIRIDLEKLAGTAKSMVTPVVVTNMAKVEKLEVTTAKTVTANQDWLLRVHVKN